LQRERAVVEEVEVLLAPPWEQEVAAAAAAELTERTEESNLKFAGSPEEPVVVEAAEVAEAVRLPDFRERAFQTLMGIFRPWHLAAEEP
jgi:hypothetical protein